MARTEVFSDPDRLAETNSTYQKVKVELEEFNEKWEDLVTELDSLMQ